MNRDINKLGLPFRAYVEKALKELPEIFITEGYRSQERQNSLYEQGRTKSGKIVTWTKNSVHTKGYAIDIAFKEKPLYPDYSTKEGKKKWDKVAKVMSNYFITWGYSLWGRDLPHFQFSRYLTQDTQTEEFKQYKSNPMTPTLKQAIQALEYSAKTVYNVAEQENNDTAKALAKRTATDCRATNKT